MNIGKIITDITAKTAAGAAATTNVVKETDAITAQQQVTNDKLQKIIDANTKLNAILNHYAGGDA